MSWRTPTKEEASMSYTERRRYEAGRQCTESEVRERQVANARLQLGAAKALGAFLVVGLAGLLFATGTLAYFWVGYAAGWWN